MGIPVFERLAYQIGQKYLPKTAIPSAINKYVPAIRDVLQGDFSGAANSLLDQVLGPSLGASLEGTALRLAGGITLTEARRIFEQSANTVYAKKNLWHIGVTNLGGGAAPDINLFATDVSYTAHTITGEAVRIGSSTFDTVTGTERVEMQVTTFDDAQGNVKRWFESLRNKIARPDGTFGLPIEYLIRITVTHAYIADGMGDAYVNTYVMRPASIPIELGRREDGLQELAMTFAQFDPFTSL